MDWARVIRRLLSWAAGFAAVLYAFILVLDPYRNVPFSPDLPRAPVATNQRFSYPSVARDARFDALVFGTSTSRLLDSARLGDLTGARFANLAMNSATAYEQERIYDLFVRHHPDMRYLVLGVDEVWCTRRDDPPEYTFRAFPEWMYDDDRWNDLVYLFNDKALEDAVRMLELLLGAREPKYRPDGYRDFTADFGAWRAPVVRRRIYAKQRAAPRTAALAPSRAHPEWNFTLLPALAALLERAPATADKVLFFPPLHAVNYTPPRAARMAECKSRVLALAARVPRVAVVDYMAVSALTRDDRRYWDPLHYDREVAALIERDVGAILNGAAPPSRFARVLATGAAGGR